jgi:hypothetical protein
VPHAEPRPRPFQAAVADRAVSRYRVVEGHVASGKHRESRNARMWMHGHTARQRSHVCLEEVEEDERLEARTEVRWAHETGDRAMAISPRAMHDLPRRRLNGRW